MKRTSSSVAQELLADLHGASVLDMTYGFGGFWKWDYCLSLTRADIRPQSDGVLPWDFRRLPCPDREFDIAVFDPPFTCAGHSVWADRYGICRQHGGPRNQHELAGWLALGISEACRVARSHILVKYKACVESGRMHDHWPLMLELAKGLGWQTVKTVEVFGHRPQPEGRTYTTKVRPTVYRLLGQGLVPAGRA